jgi:hypothetical protein
MHAAFDESNPTLTVVVSSYREQPPGDTPWALVGKAPSAHSGVAVSQKPKPKQKQTLVRPPKVRHRRA